MCLDWAWCGRRDTRPPCPTICPTAFSANEHELQRTSIPSFARGSIHHESSSLDPRIHLLKSSVWARDARSHIPNGTIQPLRRKDHFPKLEVFVFRCEGRPKRLESLDRKEHRSQSKGDSCESRQIRSAFTQAMNNYFRKS